MILPKGVRSMAKSGEISVSRCFKSGYCCNSSASGVVGPMASGVMCADEVAAAGAFQAHVGLGNAQLVEEHPVHGGVTVLAGVDQPVAHPVRPLPEGPDQRSDFHEVGPGAGNQRDGGGGHGWG